MRAKFPVVHSQSVFLFLSSLSLCISPSQGTFLAVLDVSLSVSASSPITVTMQLALGSVKATTERISGPPVDPSQVAQAVWQYIHAMSCLIFPQINAYLSMLMPAVNQMLSSFPIKIPQSPYYTLSSPQVRTCLDLSIRVFKCAPCLCTYLGLLRHWLHAP